MNSVVRQCLSSGNRYWRLAILGAAILLAAPSLFAQLPGQNPPFPGQQQPNQLPPDVTQSGKPEKHHEISTREAQEKLQKAVENKNAAYQGSNIKVGVDDQTVTLTGTVTSSIQHEMALQMARAYADDRKIVDKLVVQQ